ncbi:MAG TPA: 50S ribosomal protein L10 [Planctomycetota bacterium]|nr:50S ribosomal protein L10 [Planctomycetota bacterium]
MADKRPADKKPKGSGNPNRINRLLVKKTQTEYSKLTNMIVLQNLNVNSEQNLEIRTSLREKKTKLRMVRNRLTMKAFHELGLKDAQKLFVGPTCIVDADDPVTAAKVAMELVEKFGKSLKLTGGVLEGKLLNADEVKALAKSKTKPELIGDVVLLSKSPGSRVAAQLKGPGGRIAGAIKALVEKLEKAGAAAPAEAKPA